MRNFRTAAVAAATALTVAVSGVSVAAAADAKPAKDKAVIFVGKQDGDKETGKVLEDGTKGLFGGKGSSQYYDDTDKPFFATDAFGDKTNVDQVPQWARAWIDGTVVAAIGATIGLIIAAANFALYNGWIKF